MRVVFALALLMALPSCQSLPPLPSAPRIIEVPVTRYVPIPSEYTDPCRWVRDAPPSKVFEVTAGRRQCLEVYESDRRKVRAIQGTPAG